MSLPTPNPKEVESFKKLYCKQFGVTLTQEEAADVSARFALIGDVLFGEVFRSNLSQKEQLAEIERRQSSFREEQESKQSLLRFLYHLIELKSRGRKG